MDVVDQSLLVNIADQSLNLIFLPTSQFPDKFVDQSLHSQCS